MRSQTAKTNILRVLCFLLVFPMVFSFLFGCKNKEEEENTTASVVTGDLTSGENTDDGSGTDVSNEESSGEDKTSEDSGNGSDVTTNKVSGTKHSYGTTKKHSSGGGSNKKPSTAKTTAVKTTKSNSYYAPRVLTNSAPGRVTYTSSDGTGVIDCSNSSQGYIMVKYSGSYSNVRILVYPPGVSTGGSGYINYPLFTRNTYEAIPLTSGNGTYNIGIYGNSDGSGSYYPVVKQDVNVSLSYSTVAYARPNIIVNYNSGTSCVRYAAELTRGCDDELSKIQAIYNYVIKNFSYDYGKASSVRNSAYIPNLNNVWASKSGICYDYASVMAAMLRTQGLPTKVEVGYVSNGAYHAWISVWTKKYGWINNVIQFNGSSWKLLDPTFASTGGDKDWSKNYSYSVKYRY